MIPQFPGTLRLWRVDALRAKFLRICFCLVGAGLWGAGAASSLGLEAQSGTSSKGDGASNEQTGTRTAENSMDDQGPYTSTSSGRSGTLCDGHYEFERKGLSVGGGVKYARVEYVREGNCEPRLILHESSATIPEHLAGPRSSSGVSKRSEPLTSSPNGREVRSEQSVARPILALPSQMMRELRRAYPLFAPWGYGDYLPSIMRTYERPPMSTPFAVVGDFNGDGVQDVVVQGHDGGNDLLVAVLSKGKAVEVVEIERTPLSDPKKESYEMVGGGVEHGLSRYLTHARMAGVDSPREGRPMTHERQAFQVNHFGSSGVVYHFEK